MRLFFGAFFILVVGAALTAKSATFTEVAAGFHPVRNGAVAWGDYDNDGDLDLALAGDEGFETAVLFLYRNNGNGTFARVNPGLTGVYRVAMAWGDYDNDGDLDLAYTGRAFSTQTVTRLARNNGDGTFAELDLGFASVTGGSLTWGDADTDGDIDLLIIGETLPAGVPITHLYRNNGNGTFTRSTETVQNYGGKAAWGD